MTGCLDSETLVAVGTAVKWQVSDALDHLYSCSPCREELTQLASVHAVLSHQETPRAAFANDVMTHIDATERRATARRRIVSVSLTPIFAGATAFFSIALAATDTSPVRVGPAAIAACIGVALVAAWWDSRQPLQPSQ